MSDGNGKNQPPPPVTGVGATQDPKDPALTGELPPELQVLMPEIPRELIDPHGALRQKDTLPGWDGMPFRGRIPQIKEDDPERKLPREGYQAYTHVFRMDKPEDVLKYTEIMQVISNGYGILGVEERQYDDSIKSWRIFIRWWRVFSYVPKER